MNGTVDGFSYGAVTPVAGYLMAVLGSALGLRCVVRCVHYRQGWKPGWLALGAACIGCGIWTMHFIAMTGFQVEETSIRYDVALTVLSLAVAVVVVGAGVFIVGYRGAEAVALVTAGAITGLGVAAMHYLGMYAMRLPGSIRYDTFTVAVSVAIAVGASIAALWAAASVRGFVSSLGASLVMGVAISGMHYTGMAAVSVHLHNAPATADGATPVSLLLPMLLGPVIFLVLASAVVMMDPLLLAGASDARYEGGSERLPQARGAGSRPEYSPASESAGRPRSGARTGGSTPRPVWPPLPNGDVRGGPTSRR
ncbi:MHYT domain-containing protein [Streptomyces hokutonensis]|uniref:MHYT domain-containing protein n=1 Tax=Streptomyces hokutonensis TaxID=1306990 RepID=UPI00036C7D8E|nr:MHYT domain-containing protein [Streptomyces hokutonensis]